MQVAQDEQEIIPRVAALDIGKAEVVCCVRVPGQGPRARRMQEVRTYSTMTRSLLAMADWLTGLGVTRVVMEATSDYWKPPFYLLENSFDTWLVNAKDVKHLPGRPKTDRLDAVWLCKVAERQMLRPSFVPPPAFRELRDLTRYRIDLITTRTSEKQRVEKLLEDALLTELPGGRFVSCGEFAGRVVSVPCHGRSSGYAAGSVVVGGAVSRVAGEHGGSVRAVSAGGRRGWGGRCGRRVSA